MRELLNEYNELTQAAPFMYYILIGIVIIVSILVCSIIQYKNKHPHDAKYDVNHLYKHYPGVITVEKVNKKQNLLLIRKPITRMLLNMSVKILLFTIVVRSC